MSFKSSVHKISAKEDPISQYFSEMGSIPIFTHDEETSAFKLMESQEIALISHLFTRENFIKRQVHQLKLIMDECDSDGEFAEVICHPHNEWFMPFMRMTKFTEFGREWIEQTIRLGLEEHCTNANERDWKSRLKILNASIRQTKSKCISANLRLVVILARKYNRPHGNLTLGDIIQEGNFGLIKAVDRFDVGKGYRFSTYATWWIRANIKRAIQDKETLVRTPVHLADHVSLINRTEITLSSQNGRLPTLEELVQKSGLSKEKVMRVLEYRSKGGVVSLDAPVSEFSEIESPLVETIENTNNISQEEHVHRGYREKKILNLFSALTPRESKILKLRFGFDNQEPLTLQEIGELLEVTRERVRQLEGIALKKLKIRGGIKELR